MALTELGQVHFGAVTAAGTGGLTSSLAQAVAMSPIIVSSATTVTPSLAVENEVTRIHAYDGDSVWRDADTKLFTIGHYLGGGAAGTVYECENTLTHETLALKVLSPIGFKISSASQLRTCHVISKGKILHDLTDINATVLKDHVWWLVNSSTRQFIACIYSERAKSLRELSLSQCISLWGTSPSGLPADPADPQDGNTSTDEYIRTASGVFVPAVPPKYAEFIRQRRKIFREIRNMRRIRPHPNVIALRGVLELVQESKCTIFLVMELANGGELFDRIRVDQGTREETATVFFRQLLDGVWHCHCQGIVHRDLKPENLLLQDSGSGEAILKIADFGFSARICAEAPPPDGVATAAAVAALNRHADSREWENGSLISKGLGDDTQLRMLKSVVGSPFYVAPEVMQARGYDGPKADVWSIGVILYAMLAGNLPFAQDLTRCRRFHTFCKWVREHPTPASTSSGSSQNGTTTIKWRGPETEYPEWLFPSRFSTSAKGLIVAMLHPDPALRISVVDAMHHPLYLAGLPSATKQEVPLPAVVSPQSHVTQVPSNVALTDETTSPTSHQLPIQSSDPASSTVEVSTGSDTLETDGVFTMEEDGDDDQDENITTMTSATQLDSICGGSAEDDFSDVMELDNEDNIIGSNFIPYVSPSNFNDVPPPAPEAFLSIETEDLLDTSQDALDTQGSTNTKMSSSPLASPLSPRTQAGLSEFNHSIKRSTRFITAVPATIVMEKANRILENVCLYPNACPVTQVSNIVVHWSSFQIDIWGPSSVTQPLCMLRIYQMPAAAAVACSPSVSWGASGGGGLYCGSFGGLGSINNDVAGSYGNGNLAGSFGAHGNTNSLFLVEFARAGLDIFPFKRFYRWLRNELAELVKRDYAHHQFEQAISPGTHTFFIR